ncbi:hypothetical protein TWF696_003904 [Orbilia brochopaga]|uniref:Peptidase M43 pregnancy-associated plasma-A domain-containing protein n=1 Tax=Orbilia brochopaga TaxID=3140254 RepID=A0AAV9V4T7_9PEZI
MWYLPWHLLLFALSIEAAPQIFENPPDNSYCIRVVDCTTTTSQKTSTPCKSSVVTTRTTSCRYITLDPLNIINPPATTTGIPSKDPPKANPPKINLPTKTLTFCSPVFHSMTTTRCTTKTTTTTGTSCGPTTTCLSRDPFENYDRNAPWEQCWDADFPIPPPFPIKERAEEELRITKIKRVPATPIINIPPLMTVTIDTYAHVIVVDQAQRERLDDYFDGKDWVREQIKVLNDAFHKPDAQASFIFELKEDPDYHLNPTWANAYVMENPDLDPDGELAMKQALRKGGYDALNFYFRPFITKKYIAGNEGGFWGICIYPNSGYDFLRPNNPNKHPNNDDYKRYDGCQVDVRTVPGFNHTKYKQIAPGNADLPAFTGNTAVHEVGHWLGLKHTFDNSDGKGCLGDGDGISDTPQMDGTPHSDEWSCPATDSCPDQPGVDPQNNYMGYSSDQCRTEFTNRQRLRMWQTFFLKRRGLTKLDVFSN